VGSVKLKYIGEFVKFADMDANDYGSFPKSNPLGPSNDFDNHKNVIIRPSKMNDRSDDVPF
jgi:replicative DNA helicase